MSSLQEHIARHERAEAVKTVAIVVHDIAEDGLPEMENLTGRVAFIFDGCVVSGWPLIPEQLDEPSPAVVRHHANGDTLWEANGDVGGNTKFASVTRWIEFPAPVWNLGGERR